MIGLHSIPKESAYPDYIFIGFGTNDKIRRALGAEDHEAQYVWYCECIECYVSYEHMFFDRERRSYTDIVNDVRCYCIPCRNGNHPRRD